MLSDSRDVSKSHPCPACAGTHRCSRGIDGRILCRRGDEATVPDGMKEVRTKRGEVRMFVPADEPPVTVMQSPKHVTPPAANGVAAATLVARSAAALTPALRDQLAAVLGVPPPALDALGGIGWANAAGLRDAKAGGADWAEERPAGAWSFPEHDAAGRVVGVSFRDHQGRKGFGRGMTRGLTLPADLATMITDAPSSPVMVVEGASDVLACIALGVAAVGRPNNTGGSELLAALNVLRTAPERVLVLGENDAKPDGRHPGRDGMLAVAGKRAEAWGRPVRYALPPDGAKDVRAWLAANVIDGASDADRRAAGRELCRLLDASAGRRDAPGATGDGDKSQRRSAADALAALAAQHMRVGRRADDAEPFAAWRDESRPNVAMPLLGKGGSAGAALRKLYRDSAGGRVAPGQAITDVLAAMEGDAAEAEGEPVGLRVAELPGGGLAVDLGDVSGRAAVVTAGGWELVGRGPVPFRRTPFIGPMPTPVRGGVGLAALRGLVNVHADDWPPLVGWMVAAMLPNVPCPVLLLTGPQGTGKSSVARLVRGVVDPSPAELCGEPQDAEAWAMLAHNARVLAVDNISGVAPWWSDALCRTVTGDGLVRRRLYTDADAAVLKVKRPVLLTSIDAGALRGDLAERLLACELSPVPPERRRSEAALGAAYRAALPSMLADLLDAAAGVLAAAAEGVCPPPAMTGRMADFCGVLAALDHARPDLTGGRALELYHGQRGRVADDVVAADPFAEAVRELAADAGEWSGTAGELLKLLTERHDGRTQRGWPTDSRQCAGQLKRLAVPLAAVGVQVVIPLSRTDSRRRTYTICHGGGTDAEGSYAAASSATSASSIYPESASAVRHGQSGGDAGCPPQRHTAAPASPQRHGGTGRHTLETLAGDADDGGDAAAQELSNRAAAQERSATSSGFVSSSG